MATEVTLPALGESVTEGTVTRWLKQVGEEVAVDEPLLEVSTDKVDTEIPSPVGGTLLEIKAEDDETVEVGAVLALIGESDEATSDGGDDGDDEDEAGGEAEADSGADEEQSSEPEEQPAAQEDSEESGGSDDSGGSGGGEGTPVTLPALGESVTEGTITRWLKQVGDEVEVDEPLLEVSTDKVDTEIPSPVGGTLLEIKADEDETVEVGAELAVVGSGKPAAKPAEEKKPEPEPAKAEEPEPEPEPKKAEEPAPKQESAPEPAAQKSAPSAASSSSGDGHGYVTPLVRKLASRHGVDLATVEGSGVGGRIRKQDVLDAAERGTQESAAPAASAPAASSQAPSAPSDSPSPLRGKTEKMSRLRKVISARMVESLQQSAQLTQVVEIDVTGIARLREKAKEDFLAREGVKLSYLPFFAKAAIDALKQHPSINATIDTDEGTVTYYDHENLSIAVDTEKGLLTPVIRDAGDLSISGLAKKIADVAERTRTNKIGPDELTGGTFTITNLGSVGALWDTPIINQPQVAILGPGSVVKRPVVIDDPNLGETIAVRHMVHFALTYDHRLIDGADAGRFLQEVKQRLESAEFQV
ncbi:2-oxoglutarate dehydrogenase, E2 component, dihydrolipoamide succinyltransferase [Nocardioides panacisoli]|uniref:2-oxoglutarate dehydrogenase, E2 component, dihydrolipoamide succinyltransferase n=1 Tax=Nocardioides panacisoli TaxID=627624 RepID=UPI001C629FB3|nr:2-oxoglutarate dehydrogenase, E2 component, dihydrolipoamide succinyltransferase [Nocardioides panacisoli]QYJ05327.1 2-oxoglutarate dehydrogenase, E2 component, dihydrolipoamide succinyltransferase [Nocardioides panacisoli]